MATKKLTVGQALAFGWEKTQVNFGLMSIMALILIIAGLLPALTMGRTLVWGSNFLAWIFGSLLGVGLIKVVLKIYHNQQGTFDDFLSPTLRQFLDYLLVSLLLMLITGIGFILLVVPGVIFSLKYQFAPFLILDKNLRPWAAIKASGRLTRGHLGVLFGLWIMSILIILAGAAVFGVGLLVAVPVVILAQTYAYKQLNK